MCQLVMLCSQSHLRCSHSSQGSHLADWLAAHQELDDKKHQGEIQPLAQPQKCLILPAGY